MTDLSSRIRRAFDPMPAISPELIEATRRRRRQRRRRGAIAGGAAAGLAAALVAVLLVTVHPAQKVTVVPALRPGGPSRSVTLGGVSVVVPASWPVLGGNETPLCDGDYPANPTVYVGIQPGGSYGCGGAALSRGNSRPRPLDGIWLQPQTAGAPDMTTVQLPSGQTVQESGPPEDGPGTEAIYHGVWIYVGAATAPDAARSILAALAYRPGAKDTIVAGGCATNPDYQKRPQPERLDRTISVRGGVTLEPPWPADQASVDASVVWRAQVQPALLPTDDYRLYLARYALPGQATPALAWVVYAVPVTSSNPTCGGTLVVATDARTGKLLDG